MTWDTRSAGLRYVAIGDSVARGFVPQCPRPWRRDGCDFRLAGVPLRWFDEPETAYPVVTARLISEALGRHVEVDMQLTCSGMRTDHLWRDGGPTDILRARFAEPADVVTLTMGANDLIVLWHRYLIRATLLRSARHMIPAAGWRLLERRLAPERRRTLVVASGIEHRLARVLEWITDRAPDARVVITTYYVGDGGRATSTEFGRSLVEAVIAGSACGPETVAMVDLAPLLTDSASRPRLTSRVDGLHPTPAGQQVIARAVADAILRRRPETSSGPSSNPSMLPGRG